MAKIYTDTRPNAFKTISELIGHKPYVFNERASKNAGYNIYNFDGGWISDMETKVELNYTDGGTTPVFINDVAVSKVG